MQKQLGFTLFEVLITIVLLAVGLLGLAGLQSTALKNNQSAYYRTSATVSAYDIADRMRLNRAVANGSGYSLAMTDSAPTGATLADTDRASWLTTLANTLPSGDGSIVMATVSGKQVFTIAVQWNDSRASSGSTTQSFVMSTEL